jgi:ABC-type antimicrobial peptide transport system permease subunit
LGIGALIALALAVGGLWLTTLGDVADERGDLFDLEAQGVTPGELRAQLRLRAAILTLLGLVGGLVLGLVLASEVVRLIQVSASGVPPVPPLVRQVGWGSVGVGFVFLALVAAALVEFTVRRAFREDSPSRSGELE